jgi:hypothetical protein
MSVRLARYGACLVLLTAGLGALAGEPPGTGRGEPSPPPLPAAAGAARAPVGAAQRGAGLFGPPVQDLPESEDPFAVTAAPIFRIEGGAPLGFTGPSGILPREQQADSHFIPVEDRWREPFPEWDRSGRGHPCLEDYPYTVGHWWDPFHQNVLKGDYPIVGQNTFLEVTATSDALFEPRQLPASNNPLERSPAPPVRNFFANPDQFFYTHLFSLTVDLFHGDAAFKPVDWRVRLTPTFDVNYTAADEVGAGNPPARPSLSQGRTWTTLQEWFVETKVADLSPDYDFVSVRAGTQPFLSDFRGFLFNDTNRGVRLFGTLEANRDQFNLAYFNQQFKDQVSRLNTFNTRNQQVVIGNFYRQDFVWPGYTLEASVHYNHDDPAGVPQARNLDVVYLGLAGDGHINRVNVNHAVYWAVGHDEFNPLAGRPQDISAVMAALELGFDRDWAHFRTALFYASGDANPRNQFATGFDAIIDNPNFAGGPFSFWQHQAIPLFGTNLVNRFSLLPDLRASNLNGESNFVNPGLVLLSFGADLDLTPKARMFNTVNLLWFDQTAVLEEYLARPRVAHFIGEDLSTGVEYRPLLNNNVILTLGLSALIPGEGFKDLFNRGPPDARPLFAGFLDVTLTY